MPSALARPRRLTVCLLSDLIRGLTLYLVQIILLVGLGLWLSAGLSAYFSAFLIGSVVNMLVRLLVGLLARPLARFTHPLARWLGMRLERLLNAGVMVISSKSGFP